MQYGFKEWFASSPLASYLRVFAAILLSAAIADWASAGVINFDSWQTWVISAGVSFLPVLSRWTNTSDKAFGRGTTSYGDIKDVFEEEDENL